MSATNEWVLEQIEPSRLKNHLLSAELYGTEPDADFVDSVRKNGVLTPLLVTRDATIISGHRRRQAAIVCDLPSVPILRSTKDLDDLEVRRLVILTNGHRTKSNEQKAREYQALREIEAELAQRRMLAGKETEAEAPSGNLPEGQANGKKGEAKEIAAAQVGMSKKTAEKAAAVLQVADKLKAAGNADAAKELIDRMNKSVEGAYAAANTEPRAPEQPAKTIVVMDMEGVPVPERLRPIFADANREYPPILRALKEAKAGIRKLCGYEKKDVEGNAIPVPGMEIGRYLDWQETVDLDLKNVQQALVNARPYKPCPYCGESVHPDCDACEGKGWVNKLTYLSAPKEELKADPEKFSDTAAQKVAKLPARKNGGAL